MDVNNSPSKIHIVFYLVSNLQTKAKLKIKDLCNVKWIKAHDDLKYLTSLSQRTFTRNH